MKSVEEVLKEIIEREIHFFQKMFIEDPLFLELEDAFDIYAKRNVGTLVLGIYEKEVNSFLHRLQMAINHLYTLKQRMKDESIEINELNELYTRASNLISNFGKHKYTIVYPFRFRDNGRI